jgi:hypothetical protein
MVRDALYEDTPPTRRVISTLHRRPLRRRPARAQSHRTRSWRRTSSPRRIRGRSSTLDGRGSRDLLAFEEAASSTISPSARSTARSRARSPPASTSCWRRGGEPRRQGRPRQGDAQRALEIGKRHDPEQLSRAALAYGVRGIWGSLAPSTTLVGLLEEALRSWGEEEGPSRSCSRASRAPFADARERRRRPPLARWRWRAGWPIRSRDRSSPIARSRGPDEPEQRLAMASSSSLIDESRDPSGPSARTFGGSPTCRAGDTRAVDSSGNAGASRIG